MAQPQAYHAAYQQQQANKGTLVAGQTISVNKYTVQVERYLSQGQRVVNISRTCVLSQRIYLQVASHTSI